MEVLPLVVKMTQYSEVASGNRQDKIHSDTDMVGPTQLMIEATLSLLNNPKISYFNFNREEILEFKGLLFVGFVGWFGLLFLYRFSNQLYLQAKSQDQNHYCQEDTKQICQLPSISVLSTINEDDGT